MSRFLFAYRNTPHTTTGSSPAELLLNRRPRTRLDLIQPSVEARVEKKQYSQKRSHDKSAKPRSFKVQDKVYIRNFGDGESWIPGTITRLLGPFSFVIELADGRSVRRHIDHVLPRSLKRNAFWVWVQKQADTTNIDKVSQFWAQICYTI